MPYKVKEVADMAGVSVRTLRHYDQIGLLKPDCVSPAGYRLYSDSDLERLQQILFFKELDFDLQEIGNILDDPGFEKRHALISHKELLLKKKNRLEEVIRSVEKTIQAMEGGLTMDKKEMFGAFDMSEIERHKQKYADEVRQKYDKALVDESERRTAKYTKEDWAKIMANHEALYRKVIARMDKGPSDPAVQEAVAGLRQHITDYYYPCSVEIFRGLGDLYVNDPRFTANIDKYKPGLAAFLREAMHIYCDRIKE